MLSGKAAVRKSSVEVEVRIQLVIRKIPARADIVYEHLVLLTEILVHADNALIGRQSTLRYAGIVHHPGRVRQGHVLVHQGHRDWIYAIRRNSIPRERRSTQRIDDRGAGCREVAGPLFGSQHDVAGGTLLRGTDTFVA